MARALLHRRDVRPGILASAAFVLAACSSGHLGPPVDAGAGTSPGTVTLRLDLTSMLFCDPVQYGNCFNNHITIQTLTGQPLTVDAYGCGTMICSSECLPPPCTDGICISGGPVISPVEKIWDGSYYEASTCGQGLGCVIPKYVLAGRYVAHMCATPGMISAGDGGTSNCTAAGPQECVDVPFDLPGPSPIEATLP